MRQSRSEGRSPGLEDPRSVGTRILRKLLPGRENNCSSEVDYSNEPQNPRFAGASRGRCFLPGPRTDCCLPTGKRTHRRDRTGTRTPQPPGLGRLAPPAPLILSAQTVLVPEPGPRPRGLCGAPRWPLTLQPSILRVYPRTCVCVGGGRVCSLSLAYQSFHIFAAAIKSPTLFFGKGKCHKMWFGKKLKRGGRGVKSSTKGEGRSASPPWAGEDGGRSAPGRGPVRAQGQVRPPFSRASKAVSTS